MKVLIIHGNRFYDTLFPYEEQLSYYDENNKPDLAVFTGGADVSPHLYGEKRDSRSMCQPWRDEEEAKLFELLSNDQVPMVGICRGAQFLNVMNGGKLIQHIDGHATGGTHPVYTNKYGDWLATSTHHQMMVLPDHSHYEYIGWAYNKTTPMVDIQPEVLYYPYTKCLCVQYHPEYVERKHPSRLAFHKMVEDYLL